MQQFEEDDSMVLQATGVQHDVLYPVRAEGEYTVPTNPWPRNSEQEERETLHVCRRGSLCL